MFNYYRPFLLCGLGLVAMAQTISLRVAIQTQGVFRSSEDRVSGSNPNLCFLPTSSFENIDLNRRATNGVYNLGTLSGTSSGASDKFTLTLNQSINGSPTVAVGTWTARLHGDTLQFSHEALRYCDGQRLYIWILEQHRYQLTTDFIPVNAMLFILDAPEVEPDGC
jgi:hypothetical protein